MDLVFTEFGNFEAAASADSRPGAPGASADRASTVVSCKRRARVEVWVHCMIDGCYGFRISFRNMEGENYRVSLLADNNPGFIMTQSSQNSASLSFDPLSSAPVASVFCELCVDKSTPSSPTTGSGCCAGAPLEQ